MTIELHGPSLAPASGAAPDALIVLLHGFGSNGHDLITLAPHWQRALPNALFLAPNAPERCVHRHDGYQWWGLERFDRASLSAGARRAAPTLDAYLDAHLAEYKLSEDRLVLIGFSQGTMMALHVGPRRQRQIAGIVGYSGMLAGLPTSGEIVTKPPVLLVHGSADTVVPIAGFHEAKATLRKEGFEVEEHVSPGLGHSVDPQGIALGEQFVSRVLGSGRD